MITVRTAIVIASFLSLFGCATQSHSSSDADFSGDYLSGELHAQTLYDILSAELAGKAEDYRYSLEKYLSQSQLTKDPGIAKRAVRIAQHLRDTQALTKAATLWIAADPQEAEPHQLLANILINQGKFSDALPHFNHALKLGQHKVLLLLSSQLKNMSKADLLAYIDLLKDSRISEDMQSNKLLTLGLLFNQLKNHQEALDYFNQALILDPDTPTAVYQKAETLKNLSRFTEALQTLDPLLAKNPKDRQYNALQIQLLFSLNRDSQALQKINSLITLTPEDSALHNYLALTALDFNHLSTSRAIFENQLQKNPDNTTLYFYLGIIAERSNDFNLAIKNYLQVGSGNNILQAHTRAVSLHTDAADKSKVEKISAELILSNPTAKTTYLLMLADWLKKFKFTSEAIDILSAQLKIEPQNTDLLYARAMYLEPLNFAAAEQDFQKVLEITPDNPIVLNAFGYTLTLHTNRYQEALALIEKALALSPKDPATIDSMGWVLYKLQRFEEAVSYLSKAFALYNDPEVASHLIAALAGMQQYEEAKQLLLKISTSHPDSIFIEQARKFLEK